MIILYLLIPLTLILLAFALWAFFWAVKNDQFDDLEGPAYRILFDDDENDLPLDQRTRHTPNTAPDEKIEQGEQPDPISEEKDR
ncbi:MAG: cbb3-type cytochrome oxidase assembly protein CcoS [Halomonas sp.]|uniref:cbb3-type cytochrome oxidase assembly protein CcoS n=1 Tax=Halomonas sp. TaxID=1486246 RepID=UPI003F91D517